MADNLRIDLATLEQMVLALENSIDDVRTYLADAELLAGYPRYDRRIAAYKEQVDAHEAAITAGRAALSNAERAERKPIFTTGHCKEKQNPGGCQLHNLQCGYPKCDSGPTIDLGRYAGTYGGHIKKEQP